MTSQLALATDPAERPTLQAAAVLLVSTLLIQFLPYALGSMLTPEYIVTSFLCSFNKSSFQKKGVVAMHSEELTQAIQAAANGLLKGQQEEQRIELLAACGKLRDTLETPIEAGQRIVLSVL